MKKLCLALLVFGSACAFSALAANAPVYNSSIPAMSSFLLADNDQDQNADTSNNTQPTDQDDSNGNTDQSNSDNGQNDQSNNDQVDNNDDTD